MTARTKQRLWTVEDVGEVLGLPVRTLYDWRGRGYGPTVKRFGRYLRYDPVEVKRWFDSLDGDVV
jgi:predicted DNA-binding transcriptional regulator AlpA